MCPLVLSTLLLHMYCTVTHVQQVCISVYIARAPTLCVSCPSNCTVLQLHLVVYRKRHTLSCAMPLLEVNTAGISRRPSLGQKLKEKLLTRIASLSSTIRVQSHTPSAAVDENNAPRHEDEDGGTTQQLRSASSHPLERVSAEVSNDDMHSQGSCQEDVLPNPSSQTMASLLLRRTVTLDEEHFAPPRQNGPSSSSSTVRRRPDVCAIHIFMLRRASCGPSFCGRCRCQTWTPRAHSRRSLPRYA